MISTKTLEPIESKPGQPLYELVKETIIEAINDGFFQPDIRLPSTKQLSEQLGVSLVTVHRAMQDLEGLGYLERTQGRGTFIVEDRDSKICDYCFSVVMDKQASVADIYYGQLLEGMRQAASEHAVNLNIMHYDNMPWSGSSGYIFVNPLQAELAGYLLKMKQAQPVVVVGAADGMDETSCIDIDHLNLAKQAVAHLYQLGHRRIGMVIGSADTAANRKSISAFEQSCEEMGIAKDDCLVVTANEEHLLPQEKMKLTHILNSENRPTAFWAAGYFLALDLYDIISRIGMSIPKDISVVGVDDPVSASFLSPPLTTCC